MAKKEDIKDAGASAAGKQEPEKPAVTEIETVEDIAVKEIKTVEDLEACYPELVSKIEDDMVGQIRKCSASQIKDNMPELYQRIVADIQSKSGPNLNIPGFLLEVDDPYAAGTLRTYQHLSGRQGLRLPYVLPYKEKSTVMAIQNYIIRASGGCDVERVKAANKALEKCK